MPTPTQVTCPTCQTQLDLTGLSQIPPQVRCGQCGTIFATQDATIQAIPRQRWRGEEEASSNSAIRAPEGLLPPGVDPARRDSTEQLGHASSRGSGRGSSGEAIAAEPFDPTPPHLRAARSSQQVSGETKLPVDIAAQPSNSSSVTKSTPTPAGEEGALVTVGGVSLMVDEQDATYRKPKRGPGISAVWVVVGLVALTVIPGAILAGLYLMKGSIVISGRGADIPIVADGNASLNPVEIHWSDASQYSARLTNIKVKVERAEFGEVRARTADLNVQNSEDDSFFLLSINLTNQRSRPVDYTSWYGNEFNVEDGSTAAELRDDKNRAFPMLVFRDALQVQGHTPRAEIGPNRSIRDTIVFEIPPDVDFGQIEFLRLSLPAAAFGEQGAFYFLIPRSMLQDARQGAGVLGESALETAPQVDDAARKPEEETDQVEKDKPPVL